VAYLTAGQHAGGCVGAMSYYTASGEPPGQWAGKGAAALGLSGQVDPAVIGRLYQHDIGPGGELLVNRRPSKEADEREEAAVAAYLAAHPHASAVEVAEVRAAERGKDPHSVPYFDMTLVTTPGLEIIDRCGASTVVMWAWARLAMASWSAGGMAWSAVPTTAQDGMVFQAGLPDCCVSAIVASGR
jgi:TrwC relaxase